jgi:hypothetical protein
MAQAKRDRNFIPVALGVSSTDSTTPLQFRVDAVTGRLITDSTVAPETSFDHGSNRDVDTSAEQLTTTSMAASRGVVITAHPDNTGVVYIGNSDVTADTTDATDGVPLNAGEGIYIEISNANKIYCIGSAANQKVYFLVI